MQGKPNKFVLELLNFADDVVQDGDGRKRAVFKNWLDTLFVNWIRVTGIGPYFCWLIAVNGST